jgi:hypothetical protein
VKRSSVLVAMGMRSDIFQSNVGQVRSVKVVTETLATIVDSVVKEPVAEPLTGSAVAGIVIMCVILGSGAVGMGYFYYNSISKGS